MLRLTILALALLAWACSSARPSPECVERMERCLERCGQTQPPAARGPMPKGWEGRDARSACERQCHSMCW